MKLTIPNVEEFLKRELGVRVVASSIHRTPFGEECLKLHIHLNDLRFSDTDLMEKKLVETFNVDFGHGPDINAILLRPRAEIVRAAIESEGTDQ